MGRTVSSLRTTVTEDLIWRTVELFLLSTGLNAEAATTALEVVVVLSPLDQRVLADALALCPQRACAGGPWKDVVQGEDTKLGLQRQLHGHHDDVSILGLLPARG